MSEVDQILNENDKLVDKISIMLKKKLQGSFFNNLM